MLHAPRSFTLVWVVLALLIGSLLFCTYPFPIVSAAAHDNLIDGIQSPALTVDRDDIEDDSWPIFTSEKGGYSLHYPNEWTIQEGEKGTLVITSPTGKSEDKITVIYLDFEKPVADDLAVWAEEFFALGLTPDLERTFSLVELDIADPSDTSQQVHIQYAPPVPGEGYLITYERLVLQLSTDSEDESFADWLRTVAGSISFLTDAPTNQEELSYPEEAPPYLTLEAWWQRRDDINLASDAVTYRLQTGEVADHLLEIMSEEARAAYEQMIVDAADYIEEIDRQREEQLSPPPFPTPNPGPNSDEFYEQERIYNEGLGIPDPPEEVEYDRLSDSSVTISPNSVNATADEIANRRGLPARVTTPIRTYPVNDVLCSSAWYYGKDAYAIDIIVSEGTAVMATTQNETVEYTVTDPNAPGWGMYVWTTSQQYVRGITKTYYHVYAHLSRVDVAVGNVLQPSTQVGLSGNTGNSSGAHLHFQIHTHHDIDGNSGTYRPADLSPVKGFTPDLDYPIRDDCGKIEDPTNAPTIIEANEFQYSSQPVSGGYYWNCSTYLPNHTGSCYRAAIPISPQWGLAPLNYYNVHLTPRMSYQVWFPSSTNYRIWVCGMGGSVNDDSLHISRNSLLPGTADNMSGYHSNNWIWANISMDGPSPYLYLTNTYNNIDVHARENGMRIDRILLTKSTTYNPTTAGIRCGAEGL